ncbi:MAG TPA: hypothetical protein VMQ48_03195, partial [Candidatus Saccharimonadales bacterium]|nr:hypothetical protein [Candidatus Saccharimonadales bacterium]
MTGEGSALVRNAVSDEACVWTCWECPFFFKLVNEGNSPYSCLMVKIVCHCEDDVEEEGGLCLFQDMAGPWVPVDVSRFTGSAALSTPCRRRYIGLPP